MSINSYWKRTVLFPGSDQGEVELYYAPRRESSKIPTRGKNKNSTKKEVAIINEINAEDRLRWLINSNFGKGDLHIALTYRVEERPTPEDSKRLVQNFLVRLRRWCKKDGMELRYIWTTEIGTRGAIHHHMLMPSMDIRILQGLWPHGKVILNSFLDANREYGALAHYIIKHSRLAFRMDNAPHKRRYNASQNLKKPEIRYERIHRRGWIQQPKNTKQYDIIPGTLKSGIHGRTATPWQFYKIRVKTGKDVLQLTARRKP